MSVFTARRYAKRGICRCHVSVCVSVTFQYCIKTAERRITQITPHDCPVTLVFWHQNSLRNSHGITPTGANKCRWDGLKFATFDEKRAITRKRLNGCPMLTVQIWQKFHILVLSTTVLRKRCHSCPALP